MSGIATAVVGGAVISGYMGNKAAGEQAAATRDAAAMADPFASQRGQYQNILSDIYSGYGGGGIVGASSVAPASQPVQDTGMGTGIGGFVGRMIGGGEGGIVRTALQAATGQNAAPTTGGGAGGGIEAFIRSNPAYQFQFNEGQRALERSMAAKGMRRSGNLLRALVDYGQGQASTAYESEINRIMQMAGVSAGQPGIAGQLGAQAAATRAAGQMNMMGQIGYGVQQGISAYQNRPLQAVPAGITPSWYGSGGMGTIT